MPREFSRVQRVEEEVRRVLGDLLLREAHDPRLARLTVAAVRVSRDLTHAKVYVSTLDPGENGDRNFAALSHAAAFLRRGLADHLNLRVVPDLQFIRDTMLEDGNRLRSLIEDAAHEHPDPPTDDEGPGR